MPSSASLLAFLAMIDNVLERLTTLFTEGGAHFRASPDEVMDLTGCIFGAVPPVSFHPDLELICDPTLFTRYSELAFNAGSRDVSIIISTDDFKRIVAPKVAAFLRDAASAPAEKQNQ